MYMKTGSVQSGLLRDGLARGIVARAVLIHLPREFRGVYWSSMS